MAVLSEVADLEEYVKQNSSHAVTRRREVRMALRVLDGQVVHWSYEYQRVRSPVNYSTALCILTYMIDRLQNVGSRGSMCCRAGRRYQAHITTNYSLCTFRLIQGGMMSWEGINLASGFNIQLTYAKKVVVDGSALGLTDDFDLTTPLARFLALNEHLIVGPLNHLELVLSRYRHHLREECAHKIDTLSYRFLVSVYDAPQDPDGLVEGFIEYEHDLRVRDLILSNMDALQVTYERMRQVATSPLSTWWYIFWVCYSSYCGYEG